MISFNTLETKCLEDTPDNSPLNRESLTCFDYDYETREAKIGFYRATDTRCLYMWICKNSGILQEFDPSVTRGIIDVLV